MPLRLKLLTKRWTTFDSPVLPFLAPRVFQPWPRYTRKAHSGAREVRTAVEIPDHHWRDSDTLSQKAHTKHTSGKDGVAAQPFLESDAVSSHNFRAGEEARQGGANRLDGVEQVQEREDAASTHAREDGFEANYEAIWGGMMRKRPAESVVKVVRKVEGINRKENLDVASPTDLSNYHDKDTSGEDHSSTDAAMPTKEEAREGGLFFFRHVDSKLVVRRVEPGPILHGPEWPSPGEIVDPRPDNATSGSRTIELVEPEREYVSVGVVRRLRDVRSITATEKQDTAADKSTDPSTCVNGDVSASEDVLANEDASNSATIYSAQATPIAYKTSFRIERKREGHEYVAVGIVRRLRDVRSNMVRSAREAKTARLTLSAAWEWQFSKLRIHYGDEMENFKRKSYRRISVGNILRRVEVGGSQSLKSGIISHENAQSLCRVWTSIPSATRIRIWPDLIYTAMKDHPTHALKVLMGTYVEPHPPGYAVTDCLEFIFAHYQHNQGSYDNNFFKAYWNFVSTLPLNGSPGYIRLSQHTIYTILTTIKARHLRKVYTTLVEAGHPLHEDTLIQFASLAAKGKRTNLACEILQRLQDQECDFSTPKILSLFSTLLQIVHRSKDAKYPLPDIFEFMLGSGTKPNIITYNILIQNALQGGDHKTAWQIRDMMEETGLEPDGHTYSLLLSDAKTRMDSSTIRIVMDHVRQQNIRNDYIIADFLHAVLLLHQEQRREGDYSSQQFAQNSSSFDRLLPVYCEYYQLEPLASIIPGFSERYPNLGASQSAKADYDQLMCHPPPTLAIMVTAFLADAQTSAPAKQFYDQFRHLVSTNNPAVMPLTETTHIWNIVLLAFSKFPERLADCPTLLGDMLAAPSGQESHAPTDPAGIAQDEILAAVEPTLMNYGARAVRHHAPQSSPSSSTQPLALSPPKPDIYTWSILLKIFMDNGQPRAAEKVLTMMTERGVSPSQVTWNKLALGYARMQDPAMLVDVVRRMEAAGVRVDEWTLSALAMVRDRKRLGEMMRVKERESRQRGEVRGELEGLRGEMEARREGEGEDEEGWEDEGEGDDVN